jgi:hypothetical protein
VESISGDELDRAALPVVFRWQLPPQRSAAHLRLQ